MTTGEDVPAMLLQPCRMVGAKESSVVVAFLVSSILQGEAVGWKWESVNENHPLKKRWTVACRWKHYWPREFDCALLFTAFILSTYFYSSLLQSLSCCYSSSGSFCCSFVLLLVYYPPELVRSLLVSNLLLLSSIFCYRPILLLLFNLPDILHLTPIIPPVTSVMTIYFF